jgi:hypothetical protein
MNLHTLNIWAYRSCGVGVLIGGLWYSPLLGPVWKRANGFTADPPEAGRGFAIAFC